MVGFNTEYLIREVIEAENEVIKKALSQLLDRELVEQDFMQVERFMLSGEFWEYKLAYNGIVFGSIQRELKLNHYSVTFLPSVKIHKKEVQL
jgi:hypothetical protein